MLGHRHAAAKAQQDALQAAARRRPSRYPQRRGTDRILATCRLRDTADIDGG